MAVRREGKVEVREDPEWQFYKWEVYCHICGMLVDYGCREVEEAEMSAVWHLKNWHLDLPEKERR